jgi:hypothetical protein
MGRAASFQPGYDATRKIDQAATTVFEKTVVAPKPGTGHLET